MKEFRGILMDNGLPTYDQKEQKRLRSYLRGDEMFFHKGRRYWVNPEMGQPKKTTQEWNNETPLLPGDFSI